MILNSNVKSIARLSDRDLELGTVDSGSWHDQYADSAYIFAGGLPYELSEGDVICIFSQYSYFHKSNVGMVKSLI